MLILDAFLSAFFFFHQDEIWGNPAVEVFHFVISKREKKGFLNICRVWLIQQTFLTHPHTHIALFTRNFPIFSFNEHTPTKRRRSFDKRKESVQESSHHNSNATKSAPPKETLLALALIFFQLLQLFSAAGATPASVLIMPLPLLIREKGKV